MTDHVDFKNSAQANYVDSTTGAKDSEDVSLSVCETVSLFWTVPQFAALSIAVAGVSVTWVLPSNMVAGPAASQVWDDMAATWTSVLNILTAVVASLGAAKFGSWSDKDKNRKSALVVTLIATAVAPLGPLMILGSSPAGVWSMFALQPLTGFARAQQSGSPIIWAVANDILPAKYRSAGFSLMLGTVFLNLVVSMFLGIFLQTKFGLSERVFLWVSLGYWLLSMVLVLSLDLKPPAQSAAAVSFVDMPVAPCMDILAAPYRFVRDWKSLRPVCMIAALLSLADLMATYISAATVYEIMGIAGPGHGAEQGQVAQYFQMMGFLPLVPCFPLIGFIGKKVGIPRALCLLIPTVCLIFCTPSLLKYGSSRFSLTMAGCAMNLPVTLYPLVQSMVPLLAPPDRVGEAMGGIASCRSIGLILAPAITMIVTACFAATKRQDQSGMYMTIFPGAAVIMLFAWPFAIKLAYQMKHRESSLTLVQG